MSLRSYAENQAGGVERVRTTITTAEVEDARTHPIVVVSTTTEPRITRKNEIGIITIP